MKNNTKLLSYGQTLYYIVEDKIRTCTVERVAGNKVILNCNGTRCAGNTSNIEVTVFTVCNDAVRKMKELSSAKEGSVANCKNCYYYVNADECFGEPVVCQQYRPAVHIPQWEKDLWPKEMGGPYGTIRKR